MIWELTQFPVDITRALLQAYSSPNCKLVSVAKHDNGPDIPNEPSDLANLSINNF